jgi:hypothetical protein
MPAPLKNGRSRGEDEGGRGGDGSVEQKCTEVLKVGRRR